MEKVLNDRLAQFFVPLIDDYIFDELSENFLEKSGNSDILTGVPVPVRKDDMENLSIKKISINMAFIIGCDAGFKYRDNYIQFIIRNYSEDFEKYLVQEGISLAEKDEYMKACVYFRAAILMNPEDGDAVYCYGRACSDVYRKGGSEDLVGNFKAEALEAYEKTTIKKPNFPEGFYHLAFAYLNFGLYIKAQLTFGEFIEMAESTLDAMQASGNSENLMYLADQLREAREWFDKLDEPVDIEKGYNLIIAGKFQEGVDALTKYTDDDRYAHFWPLWYYLAIAYVELGLMEMAEGCFLRVLSVSPSNLEAMKELVKIYKRLGYEDKVLKYEEKMKVVAENATLDRLEIERAKKVLGESLS